MKEPAGQLPGGAAERHCESPGRWLLGAGEPEEPPLDEPLEEPLEEPVEEPPLEEPPLEEPPLEEPPLPELPDGRPSPPASADPAAVAPPHPARPATKKSTVLVRIPRAKAMLVPSRVAPGFADFWRGACASLCRRTPGCLGGEPDARRLASDPLAERYSIAVNRRSWSSPHFRDGFARSLAHHR
jgi:hypothetical protein